MGQAHAHGDSSVKATLLRDACAFAYLWEVGRRGTECCSLVLSDLKYEDRRCTSAWANLQRGVPTPGLAVFPERSASTKTRKSRHPRAIQGSKTPNGDGGGDFVRLLPNYARAVEACGSPLSHWLFPHRGVVDDSVSSRGNDQQRSSATLGSSSFYYGRMGR